jgi:ABC-type glutathione transport system ATPase component
MPETLSSPKTKLHLRNVSRTFMTPHGTLAALEGIDLEVREHEFLCVLVGMRQIYFAQFDGGAR